MRVGSYRERDRVLVWLVLFLVVCYLARPTLVTSFLIFFATVLRLVHMRREFR